MSYMSEMVIHDILIEEPRSLNIDISKIKTKSTLEERKSGNNPTLVSVNKSLSHHRVVFLYYPTCAEKPISFSVDCCNPEAISIKEFVGLTFSFGYDKICKINSEVDCPLCKFFLGKKVNEKEPIN